MVTVKSLLFTPLTPGPNGLDFVSGGFFQESIVTIVTRTLNLMKQINLRGDDRRDSIVTRSSLSSPEITNEAEEAV